MLQFLLAAFWFKSRWLKEINVAGQLVTSQKGKDNEVELKEY